MSTMGAGVAMEAGEAPKEVGAEDEDTKTEDETAEMDAAEPNRRPKAVPGCDGADASGCGGGGGGGGSVSSSDGSSSSGSRGSSSGSGSDRSSSSSGSSGNGAVRKREATGKLGRKMTTGPRAPAPPGGERGVQVREELEAEARGVKGESARISESMKVVAELSRTVEQVVRVNQTLERKYGELERKLQGLKERKEERGEVAGNGGQMEQKLNKNERSGEMDDGEMSGGIIESEKRSEVDVEHGRTRENKYDTV
jgi:hypothetical protein